jgi:hypothetical protein
MVRDCWAVVLRTTLSCPASCFLGVIGTRTGPVMSVHGPARGQFPLTALAEYILGHVKYRQKPEVCLILFSARSSTGAVIWEFYGQNRPNTPAVIEECRSAAAAQNAVASTPKAQSGRPAVLA